MADRRWPIADGRSPMADRRWPIADGRSPMADRRWPIADSQGERAMGSAGARSFGGQIGGRAGATGWMDECKAQAKLLGNR